MMIKLRILCNNHWKKVNLYWKFPLKSTFFWQKCAFFCDFMLFFVAKLAYKVWLFLSFVCLILLSKPLVIKSITLNNCYKTSTSNFFPRTGNGRFDAAIRSVCGTAEHQGCAVDFRTWNGNSCQICTETKWRWSQGQGMSLFKIN